MLLANFAELQRPNFPRIAFHGVQQPLDKRPIKITVGCKVVQVSARQSCGGRDRLLFARAAESGEFADEFAHRTGRSAFTLLADKRSDQGTEMLGFIPVGRGRRSW